MILNIQQYLRVQENNMFKLSTRTISALLVAGLLAACGGGGGGGGSDNDSGSRQVSTGLITGFGSVFVNNQRFGTGSATVTADDALLGMARAFYALHACTDARSTAQALIRAHPRSSLVGDARTLIRTIGRAPRGYCTS